MNTRSLIRQWKPFRWQIVLSLLAAIAMLWAGIGLMGSSGYLISRAAQRPPILDLILIIVAVRFFALARAALRYAERMISHDLTFKGLLLLRVWLYERIEPLAPALLLNRRSGDLLARMGSDIDTLQQVYLRVWAPSIVAAFMVSTVTAALYCVHPLLAVITFLFLVLNGVGVPLLTRRLAAGIGREQIRERAALSHHLVEQLQGLSDVLALGRGSIACEQFNRHTQALGDAQRRQAQITGFQESASLALAQIGAWSALVISIPLVQAGTIQGATLALITLGVMTAFESVQALGVAFQFHEQSEETFARMNELADTPAAVRESEHPASLPKTSIPTIRLEAIDFSYDHTPVLSGIDVEWKPGQRIAVVGPSGAGKSTLAHLLLRFYDPVAGVVRVDGLDARDLPLDALRALYGVVAQRTHLFNESVRANLCLAKTDADDAACWKALEQAQLAATVRAWPEGLDTVIGEQGALLSGGERQRLAIARVCLSKAPLLIFDEPTSHLDAETEQALLKTLWKVSEGRSVLWITHRLLRLDTMDQILVMDRGRIIERGTQKELIAMNGLFARMLRQHRQIL